MAVDGEEEQGREDREELAERRMLLCPFIGSIIAAKPRPIALLITSPASSAAGHADLDGRSRCRGRPSPRRATSRKPAKETSPSGGSAIPDAATAGTPIASAMTRRSWTGTIGGAEDRCGEERGAGPDHRQHPQPEHRLDTGECRRGSSHGSADHARDLRIDLAGEIGEQHAGSRRRRSRGRSRRRSAWARRSASVR